MASQSRRVFGLLQGLVALLWAQAVLPGASAKVVEYLEQGFLFDWTGDQSPPVPTAAQCDTLHITWGRRSATGPNPVAPYYLQIYTSSFIVPFVIPAGNDLALSYDWVVPFTPGTQFQICMFASNGVTGGCQNIFTVYQRPNTTLDDPPTCFNLTYPHSPLGVTAALDDGTWSQYGWVDQCSDISLRPTNGTPPYTYTIAPALHPPFNITSNTMDAVNWTVSLMYGLPFWVSVADSTGLSWTNGPLHPTGAGSTSCLDLDAALNPESSSKSRGGLSAGGAAGLAVGTLVLGAVLGLLGAILLARWQQKLHPKPASHEFQRKVSEPESVPILGLSPPSSPPSSYAQTTSTRAPGGPADEHGQLLRMSSAGQPATFNSARMPSLSGSERGRDGADTPYSSAAQPEHEHSLGTGTGSSGGPTSPRSPFGPGGGGGGGGSHVYVVHHDAGRPPPVTVFTSDGTEVVELPPQYETAAGVQRGVPDAQGPRPLPPSPDGQPRRTPRSLPPKPTMVASNADQSPSPSPS
ncbi:hypothetical protein C8Q79DRAFT_39839 [Trametes meyenii]|nr:hypothetical protein C8Q79DRAFT_39839 [Trametes meyenii]